MICVHCNKNRSWWHCFIKRGSVPEPTAEQREAFAYLHQKQIGQPPISNAFVKEGCEQFSDP